MLTEDRDEGRVRTNDERAKTKKRTRSENSRLSELTENLESSNELSSTTGLGLVSSTLSLVDVKVVDSRNDGVSGKNEEEEGENEVSRGLLYRHRAEFEDRKVGLDR